MSHPDPLGVCLPSRRRGRAVRQFQWALRGVLSHLAVDLAPDIRVNAVAPGGTTGTRFGGLAALDQTQTADRVDGRDERIAAGTLLRATPRPEDHAGAYVYLADREAARLTTAAGHQHRRRAAAVKRPTPIPYWIAGRSRSGTDVLDVISPHDGGLAGRTTLATDDDVETAVCGGRRPGRQRGHSRARPRCRARPRVGRLRRAIRGVRRADHSGVGQADEVVTSRGQPSCLDLSLGGGGGAPLVRGPSTAGHGSSRDRQTRPRPAKPRAGRYSASRRSTSRSTWWRTRLLRRWQWVRRSWSSRPPRRH